MKHYKINKGFVVEKVGDTITIFDSEASTLYTFNETASFIFKQMKKNLDVETIAQTVAKRYEIDEKKALADIKELADELLEKKIISAQ